MGIGIRWLYQYRPLEESVIGNSIFKSIEELKENDNV